MHVLNLVTNTDAECYKRQVRTLERRGITATTCSPPQTRQHTEDSVETRSLGDYGRFYLTALRRSFGSFDLVHANYGLSAPPAVAQPNHPTVVSLWGSDLFGEYGWITRLATRFADEVIVMSPEMADRLPVSCHVIPYGIDIDQFEPRSPLEAKRDLGWDPGRKHVLFPYPKTQEVKDYPRARRVVALAEERVDDPVILQQVYGVPYEDMATYMNAADALLLTSKHEGSPSTVKEALACNLPVVSTAVGDVPERLDGVSHSFIGHTDQELVDGLVKVLKRDTRSNGRAFVDDLSTERMGERIHAVYESALES